MNWGHVLWGAIGAVLGALIRHISAHRPWRFDVTIRQPKEPDDDR